jgi:hypothetical protein
MPTSHDGIATGSRRHMNTNLVESPEWKELREALRNHGEVSSSKPGTLEAAEKLISNHIRVMLDMTIAVGWCAHHSVLLVLRRPVVSTPTFFDMCSECSIQAHLR